MSNTYNATQRALQRNVVPYGYDDDDDNKGVFDSVLGRYGMTPRTASLVDRLAEVDDSSDPFGFSQQSRSAAVTNEILPRTRANESKERKLQQLITRTELEKKSDHIYYNITVANNTSQYAPARFQEVRDEPILKKSSDYYMSIVRVNCPTSAIPIFIFPGYKLNPALASPGPPDYSPNGKFDPNYSSLFTSITYGGTTVTRNVPYINYDLDAKTPPIVNEFPSLAAEAEGKRNVISKALQNNSYFYVYNYNDFARMVNESLGQAFQGISAALPAPGTCFGYKIISGGTNYAAGTTITISAPTAGVTATATPVITNGVITALNFTNAGTGYDDAKAPTATVTRAGPAGVEAVIRIMAAPTWAPPFVQYNVGANSFSFIMQTAYDSSFVGTPNVFLNTELYSYFEGGTRAIYTDSSLASALNFRLVVENQQNNQYDYKATVANEPYLPPYFIPGFTAAGGVWSSKGYEMKQEYSSLFRMDDFQTLIFQTGVGPSRQEYAPSLNGDGQGGNIPIITDFQPINNLGFDIRTQMQYTPPGEYRLIDLTQDTPLNNFDFNVSWQTVKGDLIPLNLPPFSSLTVKIMFRRKDFNSIPITAYTKAALE